MPAYREGVDIVEAMRRLVVFVSCLFATPFPVSVIFNAFKHLEIIVLCYLRASESKDAEDHACNVQPCTDRER